MARDIVSKKQENSVNRPTLFSIIRNNVYEYPSLPIIVNYRSGAIPTSKDAFEAMWNRLEDSQKTAPLIKISIYLTIEKEN